MVYARISLDVAGEGLGVQRQEAECRALCERNGWDVAEVYTDNDVSATTGKVRPEFERLLASKPSRVVVWHTDRLVRKTADLERVIALDIPIVAVTAGHLDLSTPSGRAVARTVTAWATFEGEQKSLRQQAAHRQRVESGKPWWSHRRPFGYTAEGEVHETEGPALRKCYDMVRLGSTYADAARYLNAEGFTTTVGGRQWNGSNLSRLMRDPKYAGLIHYRYEVQGRGQWEPIVPEEEWRAILDRSEVIASGMAPAPAGSRVRSLLGGIARCECGEPFKRTRQHSKRKGGEVLKTYVYQCPMHCTSINAEWLDTHVAKAVLRAATSPAWMLAAGPEVSAPEAESAAREAVTLRDRLDELSEAFAAGEISRDQLASGSAPLRSALADAEARAQTYYSASPLDRKFSPADLVAAWKSNSLTLEQRREAVGKYVERIEVRRRTNRNERANAGMVTLTMRKPN
ncbi:recombinase [Barrientosiimonas humi]|uniref:Recombinase n=1 Tax=Barrientosiimonas humi TaxID=999931 RepID=A0A542XDD3_9MICO|nr:recombinase [Barrientosiimonas humi]CAG7573815.1 hypothetical protein BH39T_PBIAJDOK_02455 [Barrientosiimonas humi]